MCVFTIYHLPSFGVAAVEVAVVVAAPPNREGVLDAGVVVLVGSEREAAGLAAVFPNNAGVAERMKIR